MEGLDSLFQEILARKLSPEGYAWLQAKGATLQEGVKPAELSRIFSQVPRFASRAIAEEVSQDMRAELSQDMPAAPAQLRLHETGEWNTDTLCRVWLLLQVPAQDKSKYVGIIDPLFSGAEVNELVALYKALELLAYPEYWITRCEEGVRSNIGSVLEAIMYNNAYPAVYLSEAAWNQMILKAFFTEKDVRQIRGLKQRNNPALKETLADYVQERLAAGRSVNPEIYKLMEIE